MSQAWPAGPERRPIVDLAPVTRAVWDSFVAHKAQALLFHTSTWLDLLAAIYDVEWVPLGVWSDAQLVGVFPILIRRLGPFRLAGSPLMQMVASTPFMGPLVEPDYIFPTLLALDDILRQLKIDHIEIAFPFLLRDTATAIQFGYSLETCQAMVVPLTGRTLDHVWQGLSGSCRRAVRKAEANGVKIIEARDNGFLDDYDDMCQQVYRGAGRLPHLSKEFYAAAWEAFARQEKMQVLLARHEDRLLAGGIFLLHDKTAYYLSGASYDEGLALRPNNLLQWRFIERAWTQGCECYDMGGAVVPGITRFKLSFGGAYQPFTRLYRANSTFARWGRVAYKNIIPLWRKLRTNTQQTLR